MKTRLLQTSPDLFRSDFRKDLKGLASFGESEVKAICETVASFKELADISDAEKWIPVLKETKRTTEEIERLLAPVVFILGACIRENVALSDAVDDFLEAGLLGEEENQLTTAGVVRKLGKMLEPLVRRAEIRASPEIPLLYLKRISTRCIFISEFDKEYNRATDTAESYRPLLKALYPRITLRLSFDEGQDPIGILLTPKDLRMLKESLELAEVQLEAAWKTLSREKVIPPKEQEHGRDED